MFLNKYSTLTFNKWGGHNYIRNTSIKGNPVKKPNSLQCIPPESVLKLHKTALVLVKRT